MSDGPPFWRLETHDSLPSTSDLCRARAESGVAEGLAVLALRQTAGRGTHGRAWVSPPGNLYLSVMLRPDGPVAEAGQWGLAACVALAEALEPLLPPHGRLRLKWPNDLMLGDAKLAGLLTEAAARPDGRTDWLVIGMGVNLATAPAVAERATACIGAAAPPPARFAAAVLTRLAAWRAIVMAEGFAPVRDAWLSRGPGLGMPVRLRLGEARHDGEFAGLARDGALLLSCGGNLRAFAAGET